jgi:hypothetical protein
MLPLPAMSRLTLYHIIPLSRNELTRAACGFTKQA